MTFRGYFLLCFQEHAEGMNKVLFLILSELEGTDVTYGLSNVIIQSLKLVAATKCVSDSGITVICKAQIYFVHRRRPHMPPT